MAEPNILEIYRPDQCILSFLCFTGYLGAKSGAVNTVVTVACTTPLLTDTVHPCTIISSDIPDSVRLNLLSSQVTPKPGSLTRYLLVFGEITVRVTREVMCAGMRMTICGMRELGAGVEI